MSAISLPSNILVNGSIPIIAEDTPANTAYILEAQVLTNNVWTVPELDQCMNLVGPGFDLNSADNNGWTIMAVAIKEGLLPLIDALLKRDPSLVKKKGAVEPYMCQAGGVSKEVVQIFLRNGANINCASNKGETALYMSSLNRLSDITKYLLLNGAVIYQSARQYELSRHYQLLSKISNLRHYGGGSACNVEPFQNEVAAIEGQLPHIQEVIGEIRKEYTHSFDDFKRRLAKRSCFDHLPGDMGMYVMNFTPNGHLQKRFLEKCKSTEPKH